MEYDLFNQPQNEKLECALYNNKEILDTVQGLKYIPNYITEEEEEDLLSKINTQVWLSDIKRRVQHYGWKYDYKIRSVNESMYLGPLPNWLQKIAQRLFLDGHIGKEPDQVIINEYKAGQGIANHVDCEPCFGDTVISISLESPLVMDFINKKNKQKIEVLLEPKSLVVISGDARYNWTHGIPARKVDLFNGIKLLRKHRLSLTFRAVIINGCKIPNL